MANTKYYNFSNEEDQKEILNYFNGKDYMKEHYPLMFEAFTNASKKCLKSEKNVGFISKAQAHYLIYDNQSQNYKGAGNTVLTQKAQILQCIIEVFKDNKRIAADTKVYQNTQYCYLGINTSNYTHKDGENVYIKVTAVWRNQNNVLQACSDFQTLALGDYDYIDEVTNIHPSKQITSYPENIRVSYGRIPKSQTYDYIYPESLTPDKYRKVSLNMEGNVKLKAGWNFHKIINYEASMWSLEKGVIEYKGKEPNITVDGNQFHYKFPTLKDKTQTEYCNWEDFIPDSVQYGNHAYDFCMKLKFYISNGDKLETQEIVTTTLEIEQPPVNYKMIPMIKLFWGCIGEDSRISLYDGRNIKISDIQIGDKILTKNNQCADVINVLKGVEKEILHIETESGLKIDVCENHPILTEQGYIRANQLTGQSIIIKGNGEKDHIKFAYKKEYNRKVYSLSLSNQCDGYIANGFIVGSFETENSHILLKKENKTNDQINEEIKRLLEGFHYVK